MGERIRAVIFDMGGVILRSENYTPRIELAASFGLTRKELEDLVFDSTSANLASIGKISERDHWQAIFLQLDVPVDRQTDFEAAFWAGDSLDLELIDFLGSLRPEHKTGLLSNAWTGGRHNLFDNYACKDVFDVSIFSYEVGLAKPDPEIFQLILSRLNVKAEETIFLDDNLQNIQAAVLLGFQSIRFRNREQALMEMRALL